MVYQVRNVRNRIFNIHTINLVFLGRRSLYIEECYIVLVMLCLDLNTIFHEIGGDMKTKKCSKCGIEKPSIDFYKQKTTKSGYRASCKKCCDAYIMERYYSDEEYRQRNKEQSLRWAKENPSKAKKAARKQYYKNHEKAKERGRKSALKFKSKCTSGVYIIRNLKENKVYIGESYAIEYRWVSHRSAIKKNSRVNKSLKEDWDKLGEENFEFQILTNMSGSSKMDRLFEEERRIRKYEKEGYEIYNNPYRRNYYKEE